MKKQFLLINLLLLFSTLAFGKITQPVPAISNTIAYDWFENYSLESVSGSTSLPSQLVITGVLNGQVFPGGRIDNCSSASPINLVVTDNLGNPINIPNMYWLYEGLAVPGSVGMSIITPTRSGYYTVDAFPNTPPAVPFVIAEITPSNQPEIVYSANFCGTTFRVSNIWNSFQWYNGTTLIPGANQQLYIATTSGTYSCFVTNGCGGGFTPSIVLTSPVLVFSISAFQGTSLCAGSSLNLSVQTYPFCSYQWQTSVNSNGPWTNVAATTDTISVSNIGWYRCVITNNCGVIYTNPINVVAGQSIPLSPGTVTGNKRPCPGSSVTYSFASVPNATSYSWTYPNGATGPATTTLPSATVNYSNSFYNGNIFITANNSCGASSAKSVYILRNIPATPTTISGQVYGLCGGVTTTYSIAAVSLATSYNWIVPAGVTILSGQGTTQITVSFPSLFVKDTIKVKAMNSCASSAYKSLVVYGRPQLPGVISGLSSVCAGQLAVPYSITTVSGATSYRWTVPSGSSISSGQNSNAITVNFGAISGDISVKSKNNCGSSGNAILPISIPCRLEDASSSINVSVSPNPFQNEIMLSLSNLNSETFVEVYDITGRIVFSHRIINSKAELQFGSDFNAGIYILSVLSGEQKMQQKIIKSY